MTLSPCLHLISDLEGGKNEELSLNFHCLVIFNTNCSQHLGGPQSPRTKFDFATVFREDSQRSLDWAGQKGTTQRTVSARMCSKRISLGRTKSVTGASVALY